MKLSQLGLKSDMASDALTRADSAPLPSQISPRYQGAIRRLKDGFGFIAGDDGKDYFFHWTGMERTGPTFKELSMLMRVEFNLVPGRKVGEYRAVGVRVLG